MREERPPPPGRYDTRKLHVSGCHTCVGVELGRLDIVTFWSQTVQRLAATGDSSTMGHDGPDRWRGGRLEPRDVFC